MSHRLIPDHDSGSEEDEVIHTLTPNRIPGINGGFVKNRRHEHSGKLKRTSVVTGILIVSLLVNVGLVIFLAFSNRPNTWTSYPCEPAQTSSQSADHLQPNNLHSTSATQGTISPTPNTYVQGNQDDMRSQNHIPDVSPPTSNRVTKKTPWASYSSLSSTPPNSFTGNQQELNYQSPSSQRPLNSGFTCPPTNVSPCPDKHPNQEGYRVSATHYDNIFEDLNSAEIQAVYNYLASRPELRIRPHDVAGTNHVYGIELHVPNKASVLSYIDGTGPRPAREARVVVERPDLPVPLVSEYVVGPLPTPSYYRENPRRQNSSIPYSYHPLYGIKAAYDGLIAAMTPTLYHIIVESYSVGFSDCGDRCLMLLPQRTSSAYTDNVVVVLTAYYATDFVTINPVDLSFVMKETRPGSRQFVIDSLFYAGRSYPSIVDFQIAYRLSSTPKSRMRFPTPGRRESSIPGTMNLRGRKFPAVPQAGPKEYEPEGKRYSVSGQHVEYLEWSFNLRMSTASGPQVWDVRWAGERIAYEISLQDVAVIYAGANPTTFYAHLSDSAFGLGDKAYGLVPGADCPEHATFLPQTIYSAERNGPQTLPNAFCLFEHNTGVPLRRHRSDDEKNGRNYGGLPDRVLILRTIIVEYNYDYIFDLVFHQNGAVEIKTYATGYVMSQHYHDGEVPFGFRIHDHMVGSIHHHLMNFKIDLDIQGTKNNYETLDFVVDERPWPWHRSGNDKFQQIAFKRNLRSTEQEAILRYDFSKPKYHIVYNVNEKNQFNNPRAYRIATRGFSKQILPDDSPVLRSRAWSKYQMITSCRKDEEEGSSSIFSMFDGDNPHVDIERYIQDNESILDQDLVFWVTVGFHHIPHTEDIPNTPTVGAEASVSLLPYNYFPECPSVGSRDAYRIDAAQLDSKLFLKDYGSARGSSCLPVNIDYVRMMSNISNLFPEKKDKVS